jgi:hypothetical protein
MFTVLREVGILRQEGKLHARLISRIRVLLAISLVLFGIVLVNVVLRGTNPLYALVLAIVGFLFGMFIFSRMNPIQWNEEKEVIESGSMGKLGYGILVLYIVFEILARTVLTDFFPASGIALILALIFGVIFGRSIGMAVEIHRVYRMTHAAS